MFSCAFFGHRYINTEQFEEKLRQIILSLIDDKGVTRFYSGFRGDFDRLCGYTIYNFKEKYPFIKNTLILSYMPDKNFVLPECFDDSAYLLERSVPKRLAIIETNKRLIDCVDYVVSGVMTHCGGAYTAVEYAYKKGKKIISLADGWEV